MASRRYDRDRARRAWFRAVIRTAARWRRAFRRPVRPTADEKADLCRGRPLRPDTGWLLLIGLFCQPADRIPRRGGCAPVFCLSRLLGTALAAAGAGCRDR